LPICSIYAPPNAQFVHDLDGDYEYQGHGEIGREKRNNHKAQEEKVTPVLGQKIVK